MDGFLLMTGHGIQSDDEIARRGVDSIVSKPCTIAELHLGVASFACFWWIACTWGWPAISATAPWIFKIIEMGC